MVDSQVCRRFVTALLAALVCLQPLSAQQGPPQGGRGQRGPQNSVMGRVGELKGDTLTLLRRAMGRGGQPQNAAEQELTVKLTDATRCLRSAEAKAADLAVGDAFIAVGSGQTCYAFGVYHPAEGETRQQTMATCGSLMMSLMRDVREQVQNDPEARPVMLNGTIKATEPLTVTLNTPDGEQKDVELKLGEQTKLVALTEFKRDELKANTFVQVVTIEPLQPDQEAANVTAVNVVEMQLMQGGPGGQNGQGGQGRPGGNNRG